MDFFFISKTEFIPDNKERGLYLLRKWEFRSQASEVLSQLVSRLPDFGASWLQFLGKEARNGAGFQYKFVKVAYSVENSDLEKNNYFILSWKLPSG